MQRHFVLLALLGQKLEENLGRQLGDRGVVRDRAELLIFGFGTIGLLLIAAVLAYGQPPQSGPGGPQGGNNGPPPGSQHGNHGGPQPVYQRHGFDWNHRGGTWRDDWYRRQAWVMPQESSGWFQRPYPYHLDYYKMRWGGSYAPYFGNLYGTPFGTPQVVNGGWGPGAGGWGPTGGGPPGYEWLDGPMATNAQADNSAGGGVVEQASPSPTSDARSAETKNSESLPTPKK